MTPLEARRLAFPILAQVLPLLRAASASQGWPHFIAVEVGSDGEVRVSPTPKEQAPAYAGACVASMAHAIVMTWEEALLPPVVTWLSRVEGYRAWRERLDPAQRALEEILGGTEVEAIDRKSDELWASWEGSPAAPTPKET